MNTPEAPPPTPGPDRQAYDRTAGARGAVALSAAPPYTLDAVYAAAQAHGISRRLTPYRSAIAALSGFDIGHLDDLADYADALLFVHVTLLARAERVRQLPALASEGHTHRSVLLAYADLLVLKGRLDAAVVARLREGSGYRDLVEDLSALVRMIRELPGAVGAGSPVSEEELARAAEIARVMTVELGSTSDPDLGQDTLLRERRKLGALLVRAQGQLRRAMEYLRYDDADAAELVPTLYVTATRGRGGSNDTSPASVPAPVEPSEPVPSTDGPFVS